MSNAESSQSAPPGYLETFSLSCEPFADRIDSRFFYAGTTLMQRLDLLTHLTQFGDSVVLVSGPPGSGKTTLLSRFVGQSNNQMTSASFPIAWLMHSVAARSPANRNCLPSG
jgi:type II secretory pathway predicted ATPase ExeA